MYVVCKYVLYKFVYSAFKQAYTSTRSHLDLTEKIALPLQSMTRLLTPNIFVSYKNILVKHAVCSTNRGLCASVLHAVLPGELRSTRRRHARLFGPADLRRYNTSQVRCVVSSEL